MVEVKVHVVSEFCAAKGIPDSSGVLVIVLLTGLILQCVVKVLDRRQLQMVAFVGVIVPVVKKDTLFF